MFACRAPHHRCRHHSPALTLSPSHPPPFGPSSPCLCQTQEFPSGSDYTYPSQTCGCTEFDGCSDCVTNDFQDCIWCADSGGKCLSGNEQGGASERCTDFLFSELVGDSRADVCPAQVRAWRCLLERPVTGWGEGGGWRL